LESQDLSELEKYDNDQIKSEVYGELYRAIINLPGQCRTIISLSYIDGLSNKEITAQLEALWLMRSSITAVCSSSESPLNF